MMNNNKKEIALAIIKTKLESEPFLIMASLIVIAAPLIVLTACVVLLN